eukprot:COSAG02_NODE_3334_length_6913_cov_2.606252_1_plen_1946_part_00
MEDEWSESDEEGAPPLGSPLCEWEELKDDDGDVFYHNRRTGQTQWDPPPELSASIASVRDSLRRSARIDYAAAMLDLSDDHVLEVRAASPRGARAMSADAGAATIDEFQSRAASPRLRADSSPDRPTARLAQQQLHDALLEDALGGVQVAAQLEGAQEREMEEARAMLRRQQEELREMLQPEPEPEPELIPVVADEDTRIFSDVEALGILQRFYAAVDPPKADAEHLRRTTDAMIKMNPGKPGEWQLKFFCSLKKRYEVDPREFTLAAVPAGEAAEVPSAAREEKAADSAVGPGPTRPPPSDGATLSIYVAAAAGGDATGMQQPKVMKIAVVPLSGTETLSVVREAIEYLAASDNPEGIIPTDFIFLADGVDRVTSKQERKLSAEAVSRAGVGDANGTAVIILPKETGRRSAAGGKVAAPSIKPVASNETYSPVSALVAEQDERVRRREREVAQMHGGLLSNIHQRSGPVKYILGGVSGRTVAATEAYIEAELQGSVRGPVAITVWENERCTMLPHILTGGVAGFSAQNLTKAERGQWSDVAGHPKASPHERMGETELTDAAVGALPVEWELPDGWVWQGNWRVLHPRDSDSNGVPPDRHGWQYSLNWGNKWYNAPAKDTYVRRRRWGRVRIPTDDVDLLQARNRERKKTAAQEVAMQRRQSQFDNAKDVIDRTVRAALSAQGAMEAFSSLHFKEAYMFKRGSLRRNWLRRWFVLHEGVLHYYAAEADIRKRDKGMFRYANMIVLDESCTCVDSDEVFRGKRCFELRTWDRVLPLYTEIEQDQEEWKAYLNFTIDGIKHILETAEPPMKRGALFKRGEWGKWTRRWFVVSGGSHPRLVYYQSPVHALENRVPIGEFDLRGAKITAEIRGLSAPKVEHFAGTKSTETSELYDTVERAAAEKLGNDGVTLVQDLVQNWYDERDRRLTFTVAAKNRAFTLSAETQQDYDEWMATLRKFIQNPRVSAEVAEPPVFATDSPQTVRDALTTRDMFSYEFERSALQTVVITADTKSGDTAYPAPFRKNHKQQQHQEIPPPIASPDSSPGQQQQSPDALNGQGSETSNGDVQFFVTAEQFGVKWTVQRPFAEFQRLHKYLVNADPTLAAALQDFVPQTKPASPPEHDQCAAMLQHYIQRALDGYKRIHQREFTRFISPKVDPSVGKLCSMEGILTVQRTAHASLPPHPRSCRIELFPDDAIGVIKRAVGLGDDAEQIEAEAQGSDVAGNLSRALDMYCHAKELLIPYAELSHETFAPEQQVELSQKLHMWSRAIRRLKAQRPLHVDRSSQHMWCTGPCLSCYETVEDRTVPGVSAVLPQDATSPIGRAGPRMAITRGEPVEDWPIARLQLSNCYVRTQPGCFRRLELIDAAPFADSSRHPQTASCSGKRMKFGFDTTQAFAVWLAAFQTLCKGPFDHDTRQRDFGIAGVDDSDATAVTAPTVGLPQQEMAPEPALILDSVYTNINARTPDHTWLAHPRRGSLSIEIEAGTASRSLVSSSNLASMNVRRRRLSTDGEYLQKLQESSDIDDIGPAGRVRALRTHSISGSVLNSQHTAPVHSDDIIVMDFGSYSLKAGRARDEFPVHKLRSLHPETNEPLVGDGGSGQSSSAVALSAGGGEQLGESWKVDWSGVDALWRRLFEKQLRIDPTCHDFIVTEPPDAKVNGKRELAERLLEDFGVPRLAMRPQAELGLLSYGRTTGLAVSLGDRLSIIPYVEGFVLGEYSFEADFGGRDVTRAWQNAASERYPLHDDYYLPIIRKWKEAHGFCKPAATLTDSSSSSSAIASSMVGCDGISFSANGREFDFVDEPWRACEILFTAPLFRSLDVVGLQGAIYHVINQCPIDQRARLYGGIELMGGSTCFDGLPQRLEAELHTKMEEKGNYGGVKVNVSAKRNRQYAPWMGGAGLAEIVSEGGGRDVAWLTLEEVEEEGYDRLLGPRDCDSDGDYNSDSQHSD